jgi:hypothetical protein
MAASEERRRRGGLDPRVGDGIPITGDDEIDVVVSSRLRRRFRRMIGAMRGLDADERAELARLFEDALRATLWASRKKPSAAERARLDGLLRKAGLPPVT